ncbi:hypothetical protein PtA15_5A398 [Puccinia triticina]|uniref:Uncharacterized protein n=1 Tax=Puccinia triticina TaxID=208348 RepID=A0ABY7CJB6_9BASI|nr:uncharacterized protein PtA15_5A398 [Puccinia triticina]WAQ84825.1 hypothetical protein PtA15_5A398 [Puccinia triticina]
MRSGGPASRRKASLRRDPRSKGFLQATFRSIAAIINYNLQLRRLNITPFIQTNPSNLPPRDLLEQLKLNLATFDGILQNIQTITTMSIAITRRDLDQAIQSKPPDQPPMEIEPLPNQKATQEEPIIIEQDPENAEPPTLPADQPSLPPEDQPTRSSLVDSLIPPLDESTPDDQPIKKPAPIEIDLDRDSSPETALNNVPVTHASKQKPARSSSATSPTSPNPAGGEPPGTANLDFKSTSDLTDGDLFGDGSLFGSSHHGSVVPSPLNQHAHVVLPPPSEKDQSNDHQQPSEIEQNNDLQPKSLSLPDHSAIVPLEEASTQPQTANQPSSDEAADVPSSSITIAQQQQLPIEPSAQLSVPPTQDPSGSVSASSSLASTGSALGDAGPVDMITTQADLSAFLSSFSQPSSAAHSTGPSGSSSPAKQALEQNSASDILGSLATSTAPPAPASSSDDTLGPSSSALTFPSSTLSTGSSNGIDFASIFANMDPKPPPSS